MNLGGITTKITLIENYTHFTKPTYQVLLHYLISHTF